MRRRRTCLLHGVGAFSSGSMKIDWRLPVRCVVDGIASSMLRKGSLLVLARLLVLQDTSISDAGGWSEGCAATKGTHERLGETDEVVGGI